MSDWETTGVCVESSCLPAWYFHHSLDLSLTSLLTLPLGLCIVLTADRLQPLYNKYARSSNRCCLILFLVVGRWKCLVFWTDLIREVWKETLARLNEMIIWICYSLNKIKQQHHVFVSNTAFVLIRMFVLFACSFYSRVRFGVFFSCARSLPNIYS